MNIYYLFAGVTSIGHWYRSWNTRFLAGPQNPPGLADISLFQVGCGDSNDLTLTAEPFHCGTWLDDVYPSKWYVYYLFCCPPA